MTIFEHISNKQLNKMMEQIMPIMEDGMESLADSINKAIDVYERNSKDGSCQIDEIKRLSEENGWLRAKLGLPLSKPIATVADIKFGDE